MLLIASANISSIVMTAAERATCAAELPDGQNEGSFSASFDKRGCFLIVYYQVTRTSRKRISDSLKIKRPSKI